MGNAKPRTSGSRMQNQLSCVVVGGGAAGFFGAIACAEKNPGHKIILLEKTRQPLAKVRISGGGRCNVTHSCFDPAVLVNYYPRGSKQLRGPFTRFQPLNTIEWFETRGVKLKVEEDGRMFPVTNSSETIINCLKREAEVFGVQLILECGVKEISKIGDQFLLKLSKGEDIRCDRLLMATGSASNIFPLLQTLGHSIVPLVPSLFTFNVPTSPLLDLAGISLARVKLKVVGLEETGPLLITHWGFSGPAILRLSAWGARELHQLDYRTDLRIDWIPDVSEEEIKMTIGEMKEKNPNKLLATEPLFNMPKQLWKRFVDSFSETRWSNLSKSQMGVLIQQLKTSVYKIEGKTTYKEEFVTCGGVNLDEVNFKTMESKLCKGLFFAGEILDIDGITGGFNFQNAWTTGWIAGQSMGD